MICLDTNIFLRVLLDDNTRQSSACGKLLKKIENRQLQAIASDLTVAEIVFTLNTLYKFNREKIAHIVLPIVLLPNLKTSSQLLWRDIFMIYVTKNVDFIDAYNMIVMKSVGVEQVYSYDHDFDKAKILKRLEP